MSWKTGALSIGASMFIYWILWCCVREVILDFQEQGSLAPPQVPFSMSSRSPRDVHGALLCWDVTLRVIILSLTTVIGRGALFSCTDVRVIENNFIRSARRRRTRGPGYWYCLGESQMRRLGCFMILVWIFNILVAYCSLLFSCRCSCVVIRFVVFCTVIQRALISYRSFFIWGISSYIFCSFRLFRSVVIQVVYSFPYYPNFSSLSRTVTRFLPFQGRCINRF